MHHPAVFFDELIKERRELKEFIVSNHQQVRAVFEDHSSVKLVISGHIHTRGHLFFSGIHYISTPSINTWPMMYTKFVLDGDLVTYEHIPIWQTQKTEEALSELLRAEAWLKVFGNPDEVKRYFSKGNIKDVLTLN